MIEHDHCSGACLRCGTHFIRHECESIGLAGIPQEFWLLAATAVSSYACPSCGEVTRIARAISNFPGLSDGEKAFWGTVAGGAVFFGLLIFLRNTLSSAQR
ncbi:MAG: hypothetical protein MOB07_30565 [Acidobacteria bacterium]|nr:hypothetical protein [Acidobacteriota bacterium]